MKKVKATVQKVGNKVIPQAPRGTQEEERGLFGNDAGFNASPRDVNYDGDSGGSGSESANNNVTNNNNNNKNNNNNNNNRQGNDEYYSESDENSNNRRNDRNRNGSSMNGTRSSSSRYTTQALKPPRAHPATFHSSNNDNYGGSSNSRSARDNKRNDGNKRHNNKRHNNDQEMGLGSGSNQVSKADVQRRINSYLHESDENCKESATLIAIVVIGLIVTGTVIGLLKLAHSDPHLAHKGSHAESTHVSYTLPWFEEHEKAIDEEILNGSISETDELGMQPLYRNFLLQKLYDFGIEERSVIDDSTNQDSTNMYNFVSIAHGSWIPPREKNDTEELEVMEAPAVVAETLLPGNYRFGHWKGPPLRPQSPPNRRLIGMNGGIAGPNMGGRHRMPILDHGIPKGFEKREESNMRDKTTAKRWKEIQDRLAKMTQMRESIETNEKEEDYIDGEIESITWIKGTNTHTFTFPDANFGIDNYKANTDLWHCYVVEFDNAQLVGPDGESGVMPKNGMYRIGVDFGSSKIDMEPGYDYVKLYKNGEYLVSYPDTSLFPSSNVYENDVFHATKPEYSFFVDSDYLKEFDVDDRASMEICYHIVTDESISGKGFEVNFKVEYLDPQISSWSDWGQCIVQPASPQNSKRWDGSCGVGVRARRVTNCNTGTQAPATPQANGNANNNGNNGNGNGNGGDGGVLTVGEAGNNNNNNNNDDNNNNGQRRLSSLSETGVCYDTDARQEFCIASNCENVDNDGKFNAETNPNLVYNYNGIGRRDPKYASPFSIVRSTNVEFDIDNLIAEVQRTRDQLKAFYNNDQRVLTQAVTPHSSLDSSKVRLGIKLARSLLLGDTFTVGFTGSSNTAGHDNMFMSSYPMQLQSLMRPLWKKIGYKGAAFVVRNGAVGGSLGTEQEGWCVPQLLGGGDDVDVVFWESMMNDAGHKDSDRHMIENHLRNSITLPRRPLWHTMIAGQQGDKPTSFEKENDDGSLANPKKTNRKVYSAWAPLIEHYKEFGAGIVEFTPSNGLNPYLKQYGEDAGKYYVTWHPGPQGHRLYADQIAYFYLGALLEALNGVRKDIIDLDTSVPLEEMLNILEEPPRQGELPPGYKCDPICTDAGVSPTHQYCMAGFRPIDSHNELARYQLYEFGDRLFIPAAHNTDGSLSTYTSSNSHWPYAQIAGQTQPMTRFDGSQGSIDSKFGFVGKKVNGKLLLNVKVVGHQFVLIQKPYSEWGSLKDVLKNMNDWFHVRVVGSYDANEDQLVRLESIQANVDKHDDGDDDRRRLKSKKSHKTKYNQFSGPTNDPYGAGSYAGVDTSDETTLICIQDDKIWNANDDFGCVLYFAKPGKYVLELTADEATNDIPFMAVSMY